MNQASIFTLEKNAKGYKDFEEFPKELYVDTSAWLYAYGSENQSAAVNVKGSRHGSVIYDFIGDCIQQGVELYYSSLVIKEAIHVNSRAHLDYLADNNSEIEIPRYSENKINYKKLREIIVNQYPEINTDIEKDNNNLINFIKESSIFLEYQEDEECLKDVMKIIESTSGLLDTQDATHVYVARSYGINSFLTTDGDFIYLDNENVFTISNERYIKEKIGRSNVLLQFEENQF